MSQINSNAFALVSQAEVAKQPFNPSAVFWIYISMFSISVVFLCVVGILRNFSVLYKQNRKQTIIAKQNENSLMRIKKKRNLIACLDCPTMEQLKMAEEYLEKLGNETGNRFNTEKLALLRIEIFDFKQFKQKYNSKDVRLFKYGIINICQECALKYCAAEIVEETELYAVFLISVDESALEDISIRIYNDCSENVGKYISEKLSAYVSSFGCLETLSVQYRQICELSERQFLYNNSVLINYTELYNKNNFDLKRENEFVSFWKKYFISNNIESNEDDKILCELRDFTVLYAKKILFRVLLELNNYIENVRENGIKVDFDFTNHIVDFNNADFAVKNILIFKKIREEILKSAGVEENDKSYSALTKATIEIMEKRFMEPNLSSNIIAEQLGFSNLYLSRKFKKDTGISAANYLNDLRLHEVVKLITLSNDSVKELVERVGITNYNYFYVLFKKKFDMTPGEYQKIHFKRNG